MHKLCFFVPQSHLETVKSAVFATGAGRYENYDSCCWQTSGQGQFRPLDGSDPFIGKQGEVETVNELKVEMICEDVCLEAAIAALRASHPYEEPAFETWPVRIS
ncbi:NGG1p interacting factor 3 protein, NIF3 [Endozoicomonas numazuensis]|uniref:NGG1p interacting factor 3 protein, NIF3 n=1 Tax=Endozoicomonas numazuensis TaxID=1137799 RepID=A0A081NHT4_9GAMM|nr:NGG1p interacting factor 3 protein, NIF3 [Endozoicomonas numazuensis]KEQ18007.1 NGG1p interacting factor 3 protein, NIF3 [Endozoicomonas numazuensis]